MVHRTGSGGTGAAQLGMRGTGREILIGDTGTYAPSNIFSFMQRLRDAGPQGRRAVQARIDSHVSGLHRLADSRQLYRAHGQVPELDRLEDALEDMVLWLSDIDPECASFFERLQEGVNYGKIAKTIPEDDVLYQDVMDGITRRFRSYPKYKTRDGETVRNSRKGGDQVDLSLIATWVWHGLDRAQYHDEKRVWLVSRDEDVIIPAMRIRGLVHEIAYEHERRMPTHLYFSPAPSATPLNMLAPSNGPDHRKLKEYLNAA